MTLSPPPADADPQKVRDMFVQFRANQDAIVSRWTELLSGHEGEWVAACSGEFLFGRTIDEAVAEAERRGWPMNVLALKPLRRVRPATVL